MFDDGFLVDHGEALDLFGQGEDCLFGFFEVGV